MKTPCSTRTMTDKSSVQDRNDTTHIHTCRSQQRSLWRLSQMWSCLSRSRTLSSKSLSLSIRNTELCYRSQQTVQHCHLPGVAVIILRPQSTPFQPHAAPIRTPANVRPKRASSIKRTISSGLRFFFFLLFLTNIWISVNFQLNEHVLKFPPAFLRFYDIDHIIINGNCNQLEARSGIDNEG